MTLLLKDGAIRKIQNAIRQQEQEDCACCGEPQCDGCFAPNCLTHFSISLTCEPQCDGDIIPGWEQCNRSFSVSISGTMNTWTHDEKAISGMWGKCEDVSIVRRNENWICDPPPGPWPHLGDIPNGMKLYGSLSGSGIDK